MQYTHKDTYNILNTYDIKAAELQKNVIGTVHDKLKMSRYG